MKNNIGTILCFLGIIVFFTCLFLKDQIIGTYILIFPFSLALSMLGVVLIESKEFTKENLKNAPIKVFEILIFILIIYFLGIFINS